MRNTSQLHKKNQLDILRIVHSRGPISKSDVAVLTDMTFAAVHNTMNALVDDGMLVEAGEAQSNGGRRAMLYEVNGDFGYVIGQNIGRHHVTTCITDANLKLIYRKRIDLELPPVQETLSLLIDEARLACGWLNGQRCIGLGMTFPGQVDHERGTIINIDNHPDYRNLPIREEMEHALRLPVLVANDNKAMGIGCKWHLPVLDSETVAFLNMGEGVGACLLSEGALQYGSNQYAGEVGHTTIMYGGPQCNCGKQGCAEALISDGAIIKRMREATGNAVLTLEEAIDLYNTGVPEIQEAFQNVASYTAHTVDVLVKMWDPDKVSLLCLWLNKCPELYRRVVEQVYQLNPWTRRDRLTIGSTHYDDFEIYAPAAIVLDHLFFYSSDTHFSKMNSK